MTKIATPAKLPNGSWGARVLAPVVGEIVKIRTAAGKEWDATVSAILSIGYAGAPSLCATASLDRAPSFSRRPASDESLLDRGLIRVKGRHGSYVRKMTKDEWHDEI